MWCGAPVAQVETSIYIRSTKGKYIIDSPCEFCISVGSECLGFQDSRHSHTDVLTSALFVGNRGKS